MLWNLDLLREIDTIEMQFLRWVLGYMVLDQRLVRKSGRILVHTICETIELYRTGWHGRM
jgi:hypothetical protein